MKTDRVYEGYHGKLGSSLGSSIRERINWICSETKGQKVLDVGCSQGITSILLAREGKRVVGIDKSEDSLAFFRGVLELESTYVTNNVTIIHDDFINIKIDDNKFDTIILGDMLQERFDVRSIFKKALSLLGNNGKLIITVPIGIDESRDQLVAHYGIRISKEILDYFIIEKVVTNYKNWIGFVASSGESRIDYIGDLDDILEKIETCIAQRESTWVEDKKGLTNQLTNQNDQIDRLNGRMIEVDTKINQSIMELSDELHDLSDANTELQRSIEAKNSELDGLRNVIVELKCKLSSSNDETIKLVEQRETALEKAQNYLEEMKKSNDKYFAVQSINTQLNVEHEYLKKNDALAISNLQKLTDEFENIKTELYETRSRLDALKLKNDTNLVIIDENKKKLIKNTEEYESSKSKNVELLNIIQDNNKNISNLNKKLDEEKRRMVMLSDKLNKELSEEERVLKNYSKIEKRLNVAERRYKTLAQSPLGSMMINIWNIFNKITNKQSRK